MVLGEGGEKQPCFVADINCSEGLSDCLQELRTCPDGIHFAQVGSLSLNTDIYATEIRSGVALQPAAIC